MATKKQKRAAGLAKREEFEAQVKAEGLLAQKLDQTIRAKQRERGLETVRAINAQHKAILDRARKISEAQLPSVIESQSEGLQEE